MDRAGLYCTSPLPRVGNEHIGAEIPPVLACAIHSDSTVLRRHSLSPRFYYNCLVDPFSSVIPELLGSPGCCLFVYGCNSHKRLPNGPSILGS